MLTELLFFYLFLRKKSNFLNILEILNRNIQHKKYQNYKNAIIIKIIEIFAFLLLIM